MQSRAARLGLIAAVVVAAVVVFVVLKNNNSDTSKDTAKGVQVLNVDASGNPVGGVKTLTYNKGDQIELHVNLAEPEAEVHVHGYEIEKPAEHSPVTLLVPGKPRWRVRGRGSSVRQDRGADRQAPRESLMRALKTEAGCRGSRWRVRWLRFSSPTSPRPTRWSAARTCRFPPGSSPGGRRWS